MNNFSSVTEIKVGLNFDKTTIPVGRLATRDHAIYFEYDASFLDLNIEISPFRLPLQAGLFTFDRHLFEGLPGVFNDSLPDGWGRLLFDRFVRAQGFLPEDLNPLDRLAHIGTQGLGALVYEPDHGEPESTGKIDLDTLADQAQEVLEGTSEEVLQELLALNGSSAGARPKALISVDAKRRNVSHGACQLPEGHEHWIVKFANTQDGSDAGAIEYIYALMAQEAGIVMSDVHLFSSSKGAGYFATKRFDRSTSERLHVHTACGLLHSDFRTPSLDYEDLISLTGTLTRDIREVEKLFRLAVFNVLAHNRDDHSKNFSYTMDKSGKWQLSPAYDLTFSSGPNGEQSTMVMGEGKKPSIEHIIKLGLEAQLNRTKINGIIEQTKSALGLWKNLSKKYGVGQDNIELIDRRMRAVINT